MSGLSFLLLGCCYFLAYCSFVIHLRSNPSVFQHIALRGKSRPPISKSAQVKRVRKAENEYVDKDGAIVEPSLIRHA